MADVRPNSGASLSPDATAFAHIVDDGGYPRAVQRFLTGSRASSARDVELPVPGPVTRIIHSADGHWLACQVAPEGGTRTEVWVVTTDPDDRDARKLGATADDATVELVGWDGDHVIVTAIDSHGVSESRLVDPQTQQTVVVDRRVGGRLADAWDGSALVRVGPRGSRRLIMLRAGTETPLLPSDPGSVTDQGVLLDDRSISSGPNLYRASHMYGYGHAFGFARALIRSDFQSEFARLLEVTVTESGAAYRVLAERSTCDLDEFAVSDDNSTVALLWNIKGISELQILNLVDGSFNPPIRLPGLVASALSISAGGSMLAVTVEGPGMPQSVELVDTRTGVWWPVEPARTVVDQAHRPTLEQFTARDGTPISGWLYRATLSAPGPVLIFLHGGPEGQERPGYSYLYPPLIDAGISVFAPNVRGSGGLGRTFSHADDRDLRFGAINDVADCAEYLIAAGVAVKSEIVCSGWSYGGYLTLASLTFHPELFAAGISICGMSDLTSFYDNTEPWIAEAAFPKYGHPVTDHALLQELSPMNRLGALTAPLMVVHGIHDTNVPVSESEQIVHAVREQGGIVKFLMFDDEGHDIVKHENHVVLIDSILSWLATTLDSKLSA